jgi:hypothetical protein
MSFAESFHFDAFSWLVSLIAVLEGVRVARFHRLVRRAPRLDGVQAGALETALLALAAATTSPIIYVGLGVLLVLARWRDGRTWWRGILELVLIAAAIGALLVFDVHSFADVAERALAIGSTWRMIILALISTACVIAIVPARLADEAKATLAAPYVIVAFARICVPLDAVEPTLALAAPVIGAVVSLLCALWLLSAGMRANHFEHSSLVSELVMCERGVLLSFVWIGLASGERLAGVGGFVEWWAAALALLALEASLRVRPLPKPMAFFALAMAVGLPGTMGFIAEDLLAHGLVEMRPVLAAVFVGVGAINAAALYLALVNLIVDGGHGSQEDSRPTAMMLVPAALTLVIGLVPRPFVATATAAREAVAPHETVELDAAEGHGWDEPETLPAFAPE